MQKRLGIVTFSKNVGIEYIRQIRMALGDAFTIVTYAFELNEINLICDVDVLLISTLSQYEIIKDKIPKHITIIIAKLTISKAGYALLKQNQLPPSAMLVNLSFEMCIETIATLQQLGLTGIDLIPVYPNVDAVPDLNVAITTGESVLVPPQVEKIIDLGHRLLDKNTILAISVAMDIENALTKSSVINYFDALMSLNSPVEFLISKSEHLNRRFKTLLSIMDKGVMTLTQNGIIDNCNSVARDMLSSQKNIIGQKGNVFFSDGDIRRFLDAKKPILHQLISVGGRLLTVSIVPINGLQESDVIADDSVVYMILESFTSEENKQNKLRMQLAQKGHIAKYTIDDIVGQSYQIEEVRKLIVRMANSKSAVLITGQSGTGKELTAQAIHNASPLKNRQFIALNCAALSSNLLESELFGYESGAFTGAARGGKMGILELAHNGTLFLDEIGDMPLDLQVKLLRVIQEKEVMRVGGNEVIKVDFRIIASTNKDLLNEVAKGNFRRDLFYRLNVLPIHMPSLKERSSDVPVLLAAIMAKRAYAFSFSKETMSFLEQYDWDGNVRELCNCIEYLENLGKQVITIDDLPQYMTAKQRDSFDIDEGALESVLNREEAFVLKLLYSCFKDGVRLGRRSISQRAFQANLFLSEYDIRAIMSALKSKSLVEVHAGRRGSTISKAGIRLVESILNGVK